LTCAPTLAEQSQPVPPLPEPIVNAVPSAAVTVVVLDDARFPAFATTIVNVPVLPATKLLATPD